MMRPETGNSTPVGLIGLGLMGEVYARRLLAAGLSVIGYDIDADKNAKLEEFGVRAGSLGDIARDCEPIVLAVFNTDQVEDVVEHGLLPVAAGKIVICTSTCDPDRIAALGARVADHLCFLEAPVSGARDIIRDTVQAVVPGRAGDFAQALMDLGATVCAPRQANCLICPLSDGCEGRRRDPLAYPVKVEKAERPTRYGHAFVMLDADGDVFLRTRPGQGLLAQMTEPPVSDWTGERQDPVFPVRADWRHRGQVVHVFTHFRLELEIWSAAIPDPKLLADGWWADPRRLDTEALPTVFRKALATAGVGSAPTARPPHPEG